MMSRFRLLARNLMELSRCVTDSRSRFYWISRRDNCYLVRDGRHKLYYYAYWRGGLFRLGIERRLAAVLAVYGVGPDERFQPDDVVLDVGADVGEFAAGAALRGATVHAFEPDPTLFAVLRRNAALYPRVQAHSHALWKEDGIMDFHLSPRHSDSSLIKRRDVHAVVRMRVRSLESFCAEHGIGRIALLKCEAEGAEPEVLEGARPLFPSIDRVVVGCGAREPDSLWGEDVIRILEEGGYNVRPLRYRGADDEIAGIQTVIVASRLAQ